MIYKKKLKISECNGASFAHANVLGIREGIGPERILKRYPLTLTNARIKYRLLKNRGFQSLK